MAAAILDQDGSLTGLPLDFWSFRRRNAGKKTCTSLVTCSLPKDCWLFLTVQNVWKMLTSFLSCTGLFWTSLLQWRRLIKHKIIFIIIKFIKYFWAQIQKFLSKQSKLIKKYMYIMDSQNIYDTFHTV
jgi:hypothetical protein